MVEWQQVVSCLKLVEDIKTDKYVLTDCVIKFVLRGFSDAFESAYGAVVYLSWIVKDNAASSHLIASKSRVAPPKTMSIPLLELPGCLLLSKLIVKFHNSLKLKIDEVSLKTDSTVAVAWIKTPTYKWKTFVGKTVSKVQS